VSRASDDADGMTIFNNAVKYVKGKPVASLFVVRSAYCEDWSHDSSRLATLTIAAAHAAHNLNLQKQRYANFSTVDVLQTRVVNAILFTAKERKETYEKLCLHSCL